MKKKLVCSGLIAIMLMGGCSHAEEYTRTEDIQKAVYEQIAYDKDMDRLVDYLESALGKPYVWGASGVNHKSYDCSSLVQMAYRQLGIELPRVSYMQAKQGVEVSLEDIKVGDLVCFVTSNRNGGDVTHIGIYVGDGDFIHAKGAKYGVVRQPLADYYNTLVTIRRVK